MWSAKTDHQKKTRCSASRELHSLRAMSVSPFHFHWDCQFFLFGFCVIKLTGFPVLCIWDAQVRRHFQDCHHRHVTCVFMRVNLFFVCANQHSRVCILFMCMQICSSVFSCLSMFHVFRKHFFMLAFMFSLPVFMQSFVFTQSHHRDLARGFLLSSKFIHGPSHLNKTTC